MLNCRIDNICEGGLHVTVPIGYGLGVGQRCEVLLSPQPTPPGAVAAGFGEGHYATVVRTQMHVEREDCARTDDCVGVGLHFDQPLVF
jgi:hypothetical protein